MVRGFLSLLLIQGVLGCESKTPPPNPSEPPGIPSAAHATADDDQQVTIADELEQDPEKREASKWPINDPLLALIGHANTVSSVSYSPDAEQIVSAGKSLKIWDVTTGQEVASIERQDARASGVSFSPDGQQIVGGGHDKTVTVWDAKTGQKTLSLTGHSDDVHCASFSPDGKRIVSGSCDNTVKIWNAETGTQMLTLEGHKSPITSVGFSQDGERIVSGSRDGTLRIWNARTAKKILTIATPPDHAVRASFSPDGKQIASCNDLDKTVGVWNVDTGQKTHTLGGHLEPVRAVSFSPDGKWIASGSGDQTVKVWNAKTGHEFLSLHAHALGVNSVSFSPNGTQLVSGSDDNTVKIWNISSLDSIITNSVGMRLTLIPSGEFTMGSPDPELERGADEVRHRVTISRSFYLGVYEVTQSEYKSVIGTNPSAHKRPTNPVEQVNWKDAVEFCRTLSELPAEKAAGNRYRLPTEAEWEYACRAGTTTAFSFGDDKTLLHQFGWFGGNSGLTRLHPVGMKKPNPWGLYDMHGNVWEWCHDWYAAYPTADVIDPAGPTSGDVRIDRGGSWHYLGRFCRSASRFRFAPAQRTSVLGFRVLCEFNE